MDKGFLGYWRQNQSSYHASSTSLPPVAAARALHEVSMRMLTGQGVKLNTLVAENPVVTDANLADWSDPSWTLNTPGTVSGDPQSFMPSKFLDDFFNIPAPVGNCGPPSPPATIPRAEHVGSLLRPRRLLDAISHARPSPPTTPDPRTRASSSRAPTTRRCARSRTSASARRWPGRRPRASTA